MHDAARDHGHWLRGMLTKHGASGRALINVFRDKAGVDVGDAMLVRQAFAALEAVAATVLEDADPSYYVPKHRSTARRPNSAFDFGWVDVPRKERDAPLHTRPPAGPKHPPLEPKWQVPGLRVKPGLGGGSKDDWWSRRRAERRAERRAT